MDEKLSEFMKNGWSYRTEGGGSGGSGVLWITSDGSTYDKTWDEIKAAYESNIPLALNVNGTCITSYSWQQDNDVIFTMAMPAITGGNLGWLTSVVLFSDGSVRMNMFEFNITEMQM